MSNYFKKVDVLKKTNDYSYYKKVRSKHEGVKGQSCRYCPPYGGCNFFWKKSIIQRSWKSFRKTQWKL